MEEALIKTSGRSLINLTDWHGCVEGEAFVGSVKNPFSENQK